MPSTIRIGDLTLDTGRQRLSRGAEVLRLGPLTYKLLLALADAAPNVATHDDLSRAVWDGRPVGPETISQRVKLLRDAIGDDATSPRYIELIRGCGYRLLPKVVTVDSSRRRRRRWAAAAAALTLLVAAALFGGFYLFSETVLPTSNSIAVLPFADMSPDRDQEYLADGVAEEILTLLAKTTSMRVIARTSSFSFRDRNADIPTIAATLNVTHVLEGSIRKSGDRVRITVQLVDASDGSHVWSDTYERRIGDILVLQRDIAASVASALQVNGLFSGQAASMTAGQVDPAAFELYLQGLRAFRFQSGEGYYEAERYFERAIRIDPDFIPAYTRLGFVYVLQVVTVLAPLPENREKLRDVVQQGLALAPDNPGLIALSGQLARYDGDVELAERRFRQALEMDPSSMPVRHIYAMMKLDQGRPHEALEVNRPLMEIDPLNPHVYIQQWACHLDLWDLDEALAAASRYQEVAAPTDITSLTLTGSAKVQLSGDFVGLIRDNEVVFAIEAPEVKPAYAPPLLYYYLGDVETGDAAFEVHRKQYHLSDTPIPDNPAVTMTRSYRYVVMAEIPEARQLAVPSLLKRKRLTGMYPDVILSRLAVDELIGRGEAARVVKTIEAMAPVYREYRSRHHIPADYFYPAPILVKSAFSSFPAKYFPDYVRALRAIGDETGAANMLNHLEAILQSRRDRGLFVEERYQAEASALRGNTDAALDALEQAERDRTIYHRWHLFLLHNEIFTDIRHHPRFQALVGRVQADVAQQRSELNR